MIEHIHKYMTPYMNIWTSVDNMFGMSFFTVHICSQNFVYRQYTAVAKVMSREHICTIFALIAQISLNDQNEWCMVQNGDSTT